MGVPFFDARRHFEARGADLRAAVESVLASGHYIDGPAVAAFENAFAEFCGTRHCVGTASGTDALELTLAAIGVGAGDEVVTVPTTFVATVEAICRVGARPVFVDAEERFGSIDPAALERALSHRTKAVVAVELYGHPGSIARVLGVAGDAGVPVVEDACQAHGARMGSARAGSLGAAGCFSFYPTKNLGGVGDAGAMVTNDGGLAVRIRALRDHGQERKHRHELVGCTGRLDTIQAAVISTRLSDLDEENGRRRALSAQYDAELDGLPIEVPSRDEGSVEVFHTYVVRCNERDALRDRLSRHDVGTAVHYPVPVHLQPAYAHLGHRRGDFPVAEAHCDRVLSLPMFPELTSQEVSAVCAALRAFYVGGRA